MRLSAFAGVLLLGCTTVEAARLAAPSNVTPTGVADDAIEVTWTTDEPNLVGFWVERSKPGKRRGFKKIATINDGSARSYVDTGLQSETIYYYRLRSLQEKRTRSGKLRRPKKSRKTKPVSGWTLADAPAPQPTATPTGSGGPPPPPSGGPGSPWADAFGSRRADLGMAVAVDAGGNVVTTGRFMDRADFGGSQLRSRGGFDAYLARYAPDGTHLWSKGFGGRDTDSGTAVATDAAGNVVVTGYFSDSINLGGQTLTSAGRKDIFLAKYAADGTHLWSHSFGGAEGEDIGYGVGTDAAGNVVLAATFRGNVSFGGTALRPSRFAPTAIAVAKYAPDGSHLWSRLYVNEGRAVPYALAVALDGTMALTGQFSGSLDLGGNRMMSTNFTDDAFVARLAADGSHVWSRSFGGDEIDYGSGVAIDPDGDVVVTGLFRFDVDFGGGVLQEPGVGDIFVAKYAGSTGAHRWSRQGGSPFGTDVGKAVAVDPNGNVVVTGWIEDDATFGGRSVTSAGSLDGFLVQYSSNGAVRSAEALGGTSDDVGNGVACSPDGLIVATGAFSGRGSFRGQSMSSTGDLDVYLVQLEN